MKDFKDLNKESFFYIVGPPAFVKDMIEILKKLKIKRENIKTEMYG